MSIPLFDDPGDAASWLPVASGEAQVQLSRDGEALRVDFDFHGGGGFVVARRQVALHMPESFELTLRLRGDCRGNHFELKFEDPARRNVWRHVMRDAEVSAGWRSIVLRRRDIEFAWGPAGGGGVAEVGAVEFAIVAGCGGKGTVWLSGFDLEDRSPAVAPVVLASSVADGSSPASVLHEDDLCWCSSADDASPWWSVDFQGMRESGGLALHWGRERGWGSFVVESSLDGTCWNAVGQGMIGGGSVGFVRLAGDPVRCLRLSFRDRTTHGAASLRHLTVMPQESGRTAEDFLHTVAQTLPRGWMPRCWRREQSYWTSTGTPDGGPCPIINEEGMVEVDRGAFSLEPFLLMDGRLISWADVEGEVSLAGDWLPLPQVKWRIAGLEMQVTACVVSEASVRTLHVAHHLLSRTDALQKVRLLVCVRPFQVTPPWQKHRGLGGASPVHDLRVEEASVCVNGGRRVHWSRPSSAAGGMTSAQGVITDWLAHGAMPDARQVKDDSGLGSAVFAWDLTLQPGGTEVIEARVPLDGTPMEARVPSITGSACERVAAVWREVLGTWDVRLPSGVAALRATWKTAVAHILIHREGHALQPGPRRYTRCWIRDATTMAAALLRAGRTDEVRGLLRWYVGFQREDGFIPCCVDADGPDRLVEHDSHGQFIHLLHEYGRFTRDEVLVRELWPAAVRALEFLRSLRGSRLSAEYTTPKERARFGLLPESASHEGYLAHPVHAYWDDFWALRAVRDAMVMARELGDEKVLSWLAPLHEDFTRTLGGSLLATVHDRQLRHVPGSVEWADFDPAATSVALALLDHLPAVPDALVQATFDQYLAGFRDRIAGRVDWANCSAYEIRIVGALVRSGRRAEAWEVMSAFLSDRRPLAWNQWPEISWRDPRSPGHLGDVPHTWIAAEFALAARSLFVHERDSEQALVLAAGVPMDWLAGDGVGIRCLPTPHGVLSYTLRRADEHSMHLSLWGDMVVPPGGFIIAAPVEGPVQCVTVNGRQSVPGAGEAPVVRECPAEIAISWSPIGVPPRPV